MERKEETEGGYLQLPQLALRMSPMPETTYSLLYNLEYKAAIVDMHKFLKSLSSSGLFLGHSASVYKCSNITYGLPHSPCLGYR